MKTYWLQVETKDLLPISAINGILNEICVKNKNSDFPAKYHKKVYPVYPFPAFSVQFFKNTLFPAFPAFPAIVATLCFNILFCVVNIWYTLLNGAQILKINGLVLTYSHSSCLSYMYQIYG